MNNPLPDYSEYRLQDAKHRLEGFRTSIGRGQLSDDIDVAIECIDYIYKSIRVEPKEAETPAKPPHWIIIDHGFAGQLCRCSACHRGTWDVYQLPDKCMFCGTPLDPNEIEYGV